MWLLKFFNSSIGSKLIMSLTGLFLCSFLLVHMAGNLQLFVSDQGASFNAYAKFMTSNPLIKTISYGLYAMILLHAVKGILIWLYNRNAKGQTYAGKEKSDTEFRFASHNMATLGIIVFAFIGTHMYNFWAKMHFGTVPPDAAGNKNLYILVAEAFQNPILVAFYVVSMIALSLHLLHGFSSGFQTLGLNHKKYTPIIKSTGITFAILVPLGFAAMPLFFYMKHIIGF